jgi:hypothetical protein
VRTLTQSDCIALWEAGRSLHPLDRSVLAIRSAFPELQESVADWPLGRRNRALAQLRCGAFGSLLRGWTQCGQCAQRLEFRLDGQLLAQSSAPIPDAQVVVQGQCFRLPSSRDLAAVVDADDPVRAAQQLLQRCSTDEMSEPGWSEQQIEAIGESMAAADPLAEILVTFDCPNCGSYFQEALDLPSFLWAEIEARAKRTLMEVHALASTYGWSQAEILSLSPARREFYVDKVHA